MLLIKGQQREPRSARIHCEGIRRMANLGPERRLAAVFAADMVGYSRLMEVDEAGTLARLKAHRIELIDPAIAKSRGRIIKTTGDGMLVEFQSVVDAVVCAVEIQRRMARRNADVPPARQIQFRIGINLGDVIVDGDDIFGDGVNIAARLEASLNRAASVSPRPYATRPVAGWRTLSSKMLASSRSKTSRARVAFLGFGSTKTLAPPRRPRTMPRL